MGIETVPRVGHPVDWPHRTCCQKIGDLIRVVTAAVVAAFARIGAFFVLLAQGCFRFINAVGDRCFNYFCIRVVPIRPPAAGVRVHRPVEILRPIDNDPIDNGWDIPVAGLVDEPVDMEALKAALRRGRGANQTPISRQMTPRNFIELLDEFANEKARVGVWAKRWANNRVLKADPTHPYYAILQDAMRLKGQLEGDGHSDDLASYSVKNQNYYAGPKFPLIIKSTIGFQELTAPDNEELLRKLDDRTRTGENPAFKYACALSKIFTYPNDRWSAEKVHVGSGAIGTAHLLAREHNSLIRFFNECFIQGDICFDLRVTKFQEFSASIILNPDFTLDIAPGSTIERHLGEHYRVFRNEQIRTFCNEHPENQYPDFKAIIERGVVNNRRTQNFYRNYCNRDRFAGYLQEKNQPIKENGEPITRARWEGILTDEYWE